MAQHRATLGAFMASLYTHRYLIYDMARRDVLGRYKGSVLGIFWSLAQPLLMLAIYTFVFSHIFKARWTGNNEQSQLFFAINLFSGLLVFNIFSECLTRAPSSILSQSSLVTRVVFPLEILPVVNLLSAIFHACIGFSVLVVAAFITLGELHGTMFLLPLVLLPFLFLVLGLSWSLAATGVYLRDIGQTINLAVTGLLFLSPVFFPLSALPERWQYIANFNPLSFPIEITRQLLILGILPDWMHFFIYFALSMLIAVTGFVIFQKLRNGFADVI